MLIGGHMNDMIELDETHYVCVPYFLPNTEAIESIKDSNCVKYTFEELEEQRGSHPNLKKMWDIVSVWQALCERGGKTANTPHSDWCPAYE